MDQACAKPMKQIEDGGYTQILKQDVMQTIHKYGIACYKKSKILYGLENISFFEAKERLI